jgi:hypothetical protein
LFFLLKKVTWKLSDAFHSKSQGKQPSLSLKLSLKCRKIELYACTSASLNACVIPLQALSLFFMIAKRLDLSKSKNSSVNAPDKGNSTSNVLVNSNPLDRLCSRLLSWKFVQDASKAVQSRADRSFDHVILPEGIQVLPNVYKSFEDYASAWEPLMIEEMKESILSHFRIPKEPSIPFHTNVLEGAQNSIFVTLISTFADVSTQSIQQSSYARYLRASLDLISHKCGNVFIYFSVILFIHL